MELIRYLERYFFTREQLLDRCAIEGAQLARLQAARMAPAPSYRLRLDIGCDSFFGPWAGAAAADYYAKGYVAWIGQLAGLDGEAQARALFDRRYMARLDQLRAGGIAPSAPAFASDEHLGAEWSAFLDGTYGLCTVSGLPEDIAAKEAAVEVIKETAPAAATNAQAKARLSAAVDLLDSVAAPFAPHEVAHSSRQRYVNAMREAHRL